jgi:hypothetical protein
MSGDFDPRDYDTRERDDGVHDREEEWLTLGRGPGSAALRDGAADGDVRDRNEDSPEIRCRSRRVGDGRTAGDHLTSRYRRHSPSSHVDVATN